MLICSVLQPAYFIQRLHRFAEVSETLDVSLGSLACIEVSVVAVRVHGTADAIIHNKQVATVS